MRSGYILVATMLLVLLATSLVVGLVYRIIGMIPYAQQAIEKEKCLLVIDGGATHIQGLLTYMPEIEKKHAKEAEANKKSSQSEPFKVIMSRIFPYINRWRHFEYKEASDGVDAKLLIYTSVEDGKININGLYDFETKKFVAHNNKSSDPKKLIMPAFQLLEKQYKITGLSDNFEKFLKTYDGPFNDISELCLIPGFEACSAHMFTTHDSDMVALSDLFTVVGNRSLIKPWFFSRAVQRCFGLKEKELESDKQAGIIKKWINDFPLTVSDWPSEWSKVCKDRYQQDYAKLSSEMVKFFDITGVPQFFMVICIGEINNRSVSGVYYIEVIESRENNQVSYQSRVVKRYIL